jgi:hypothetical protein
MSKGPEYTILKEDIQMVKKYKKKHSTLIMGDMQTRSSMRYHFILIIIITIKKPKVNKCWWLC